MIEILQEQLAKAVRDNGGLPIGIQGGPHRVYLFWYRGIDMAMYADQINYQSVKRHIEERISRYVFPKCGCGREMPVKFKPGMKCVSCCLNGVENALR